MNHTTATPAEVDARLVELTNQRHILNNRAHTQVEIANRSTDPTAREQAAAKFEKIGEQGRPIVAEIHLIEDEYARRGGWNRVYVVPNGHAHRSQSCHSLYPTTQIGLYPPLSGATEEQIVEAAGERACTHCYPGAPVKKSTIRLESEKEYDAARAAREEAKAKKAADKAAKAITAPDGSPLRDDTGWKIETVAAAQQYYCATLSELANTAQEAEGHYRDGWRADREAYAARLLEALAAKHGEPVERARERLAPKVAAKIKRDAREWAATAKRLGL